MNILLKRDVVIEDVTQGQLYLDGDWFCYTLEDPIREAIGPRGWYWRPEFKVPGRTAIPAGRYPVTVTFSDRFKRRMPLIMNVPNFTGIRFHGGSTVDHTEGCPLIGRERNVDRARIGNSDGLTQELVVRIDAAEKFGKVYVEVKNP